jgi:hypothetical protein
LNKISDLIILKGGEMTSNSREQRRKLGLIKPFLGNAMKFFLQGRLLWEDAGDYLVTSNMRARLKRSLSMASLRDNQCASLVFAPILFVLQINY